MLLKVGGLAGGDVDEVLKFIDDLKDDPDRQGKVQRASKVLLDNSQEVQRHAALQAAAQTRFMGRWMQWAKDAMGKGRFGRKVTSMYEAGKAFLVGTNADMVGGRYSLDYAAKSAGISAINELDQAAKKLLGPKWFKLAHDKAFTLDLVKEMGGEKTENKMAQGLAKIFKVRYRRNIKLMNSAGASITELDNYRFTQNQVPGKVANVGKARWISDIKPLLDMKRMFWYSANGIRDADAALSQIYDDIVHMKYQDPFSFIRSRALADQLGRHRSLHFKDAESAIKANELYGHDTPLYNMVQHLQRQMHDYKLMDMMGPNPEKFYDWMKQSLINESEQTNTTFSQSEQYNLDNDFNIIMNRHNQVASYNAARVWQSVRDMTMMAHLGFSTISAFSDAINGIATVHRAGMPLFQSYAWAGKTFLRFLSQRAAVDPEFARMLPSVAVGHDAGQHYAVSRWDSGAGGPLDVAGSIPDKLKRANGVMFGLNRQAYWDDVFKAGTTHAIMNSVALHTRFDWEKLPPRFKMSMEAAGIDEAAWGHIQATEHSIFKGNHFIIPDQIKNAETADRFATMLLSESERTVPLPGARQTATMRMGTSEAKRGDFIAELVRTMGMFKTFPLGVVQKVWPNIQDGGFPMVLTAVVGSIMMGYMGNSLKNVLSGKEPDDISHLHTWLESAASGGMGSVFADFFSTQKPADVLSRFLGGPAAGEASDLATIPWAAMQSHAKESRGAAVAEAGVHFLKGDVPFTNLWFTKLLYQYGLIYSLMEASHPGSVKKSIDDAQRKYNTKFWIKPTTAQ